MLFEVSKEESDALGYKIARGTGESLLSPEKLLTNLEKEEIDVLKLSLSDSTADLYTQLDQLKLPYYLLGIVIEYKSNFSRNAYKPYLNEHIEFEEYLGKDPKPFKELVNKVFSNSPGSFYTNPGLIGIQDEAKQIACLANYVSTLNKTTNDQYYTHLIKFKGELAGFVTSYQKGSGGAATYAGLLKKFEGKGLYLDLVNFIQNYGKEIGQKWGKAYVQIQNTVVQKIFHKQGLVPHNYILNIHVNCFYGQLKDKN